MRSTPILLAAALAAAAFVRPMHAQTPEAAPVAGDWQGALQVPGAGTLRIVFHITADPDGLAATLDSPDQGAYGIPAGPVRFGADSLVIEVPAIQGRYAGVLRGDTVAGTWSQGPAQLPLVLTRTTAEALRPNRPQHPEPPYPYDAVDVTFENAEAGITLAGTLTRPKNGGPFPAVVLISGSGAQDRDETLFGHKPFLVLADHLTRRGIAVLRYDDRGVGGSTGDFASATTADFTSDVLAAVRYLRARDDIDADRIGLIGHSEGGIVAPMAANRSEDVAFIVLLAGPGIPLESLLPIQAARIARAGGAGEDAVEQQTTMIRTLFRVLRETPDPDAAADQMRRALHAMVEAIPAADRAALGLPTDAIDDFVDAQVRRFNTPWMRYLAGLDPADELRTVSVPVLALNGGLDLQVPPDVNLPPIEHALREAGNKDVEIVELPGLNHLFQPTRTGSPAEYGRIEATLAPEALQRIAEWIGERVGKPDA